jgi:hypothetical protein
VPLGGVSRRRLHGILGGNSWSECCWRAEMKYRVYLKVKRTMKDCEE